MTASFLSLDLGDEAQTLALGARLAAHLKAGDFIALTGPLGAGKTTLARGLIRAFVGEAIDVPSPTFTLVQAYSAKASHSGGAHNTHVALDLFHFDLYRLKSAEEVWELGWEDLSEAVALVEWSDKATAYLPDNRLEIILSFSQNGRIADFYSEDNKVWKERLNGA
jgi:tRNA threonylcarbamoyladenosine biosynthesis protein TsaE